MFSPRKPASRRSPAESDLPPTLTPEPIHAMAPRASRITSLLLSCVVYGGMTGAGLSLAGTAVIHPGPPKTDRHIDLDSYDPAPPKQPAFIPHVERPQEVATRTPEALRPPDWKEPDTSKLVPETPTHLPTENRATDSFYTKDMREAKPGEVPTSIQQLSPRTPVASEPSVPRVHEVSLSSLRVLHQGAIQYPSLARMARVQGPVQLLMTIDEQGRPADVQVVSGPIQLQAEALRSAREWRFEPARANGEPIRARFHLTLVFKLV